MVKGKGNIGLMPEKKRADSGGAFPYLICFAFSIAVFGLMGNLMHLQSLMTSKKDVDEDLVVMNHLHRLDVVARRQAALRHQQRNQLLLPDEQQVFQRLLQNSIASLEDCERQTNGGENNNKSNEPRRLGDEQSHKTTLSRFGFMNALTNYLAEASVSTKAKTTTKPLAKGDDSSCRYAPSTACHVSSYSMIVTTVVSNVRVLFLNLLSWLTYPSVGRVGIILPKEAMSSLESDSKYGNRLLTWDADPDHKVTLVFVEHGLFWNVNWTTLVEPYEEAILWMNGDVSFVGNHRGIEAGFRLWKQHSDALITSKGWKTNFMDDNVDGEVYNEDVGNHTLVESVPVCKDESIVLTAANTSSDPLQIPELSGLIMHRNYLCFLSHPVLKNLRRHTHTIEESRLAVSVLLTQLSDEPPRLFPPAVMTTTTATRTRRLLDTPHNRDSRRRQLLASNDNKFITDVVGFFGSLTTHSVSWCPEDRKCSLAEEVPESQLSWMQQEEPSPNNKKDKNQC